MYGACHASGNSSTGSWIAARASSSRPSRRSASATTKLVQPDGRYASPGVAPIASTIVPGSPETAVRVSSSDTWTSVPAGASKLVPSTVNVARPRTTT